MQALEAAQAHILESAILFEETKHMHLSSVILSSLVLGTKGSRSIYHHHKLFEDPKFF